VIRVEHTAHSSAPRELVWRELAALGRWHEWGPWVAVDLEGEPGVGAVRTLRSDRKRIFARAPYTLRERVTLWEPGERLGYELLSGLPVKNYNSMVTLTDSGGGTDIHWASTFDAPPLMRRVMRDALLRTVYSVSERLAGHSDRIAAGAR
jgi:hypothetical protein